jgi:formate--tetrahydrofolate ligase
MTMTTPSDLEIAQAATFEDLETIGGRAGIDASLLEPYGDHVAKIRLSALGRPHGGKRAKYILVSAITPTPLGEGKTTTTVGLGQAFSHLGKTATIAIRQPSLGPTFGIKGGAAGGGYSQVIPMERLNLHLTGDFHAVTSAHNMMAALLDSHLFHGNEAGIDPETITWRRVLDVNDRSLRNIVIGLGGREDGITRQTGFDITAASEVMAVLALASSIADLRARLGRIVVGYTRDGVAVTAEAIGGAGAMAAILADALKPNLLQTLEHTPALIHGGPFGNIAHGNSSVIADLIGIDGPDVLLTEAGFGADMGAERFCNIKCRASGLTPDAAVMVVTVRALKSHSGAHRIIAGKPLPRDLFENRPDEVRLGGANLVKQIENLQRHGLRTVVAINAFPEDHPDEYRVIEEIAASHGCVARVTTHHRDGGAGAVALAEAVWEAADERSSFRFLYEPALGLEEKIERIATEIYGADGIDLSPAARRQLEVHEANGFSHLGVCIAKTHLSISSDPTLVGAPTGWRLPVREIRASVGAGFLYAICGEMRTMPGLGTHPAAHRIDITATGQITGLS